MYRYLILISILTLIVSSVQAGTDGILEGKVINKETKEPLIGVTIAIIGTNQGTATDTEGNFSLNNLEAGMYDIRFSNIGFQSIVYKAVVIRIGLRTKISVELVPSAVELSVVEVIAERPLIEKDVTSTHFSIGSSQVEKLPVRSVQDIITLFPSVTAEGNVRGGKSTEVVYLVDGLPLQDVVGGGVGGSLPKSSITEFSIQSGGFEAEYGNALSGVVNIITRRGGNDHSLVLRLEKDNWISGNLSQQHNRSDEVELTLSGPVVRDRMHYFTANTIQLNDTRWWQDFDNFFKSPISSDLSGIGKIDYSLSSKIHLTAQTVYSLRRWRDYEFSWRFNLDGLPERHRTSYRATATLAHTLTKRLHYSISLSTYDLRSKIGGDKNALDLTPYEYDFFLEYVVSGSRAWWSETRQNIYTAKTDIVFQPNQYNVVKAGFEYNQYDIFSDVVKYEPQKTYFGKVMPDAPLLNYSSAYHYYPRTGSAYVQEKLEVDKDGAVVNLGFRWDFLDPRTVTISNFLYSIIYIQELIRSSFGQV
ncbi:MAG: TonB-dependent receptor [Ignavibacteriales bacterium]|nr:TonB-dependent receptor [Ignavibacteriales bacterium]